MKVLGLSGSLRAGSHNSKLLRAAADLLPAGGRARRVRRPQGDPAVRRGRRARPPRRGPGAATTRSPRADAVLVATPEYNHSIPGQLKNALDWLSRPLADSPLRNKPTAVVGASTGLFGAVWAQAEARKVLSAIGARVIDRELPIGLADDAFTPTARSPTTTTPSPSPASSPSSTPRPAPSPLPKGDSPLYRIAPRSTAECGAELRT